MPRVRACVLRVFVHAHVCVGWGGQTEKRRSAFGDTDVGLNGGKWSPEEDENLKRGVEVLGPKRWLQISHEYLGTKRSAVQCLHRWQKVWQRCSGRPVWLRLSWLPLSLSLSLSLSPCAVSRAPATVAVMEVVRTCVPKRLLVNLRPARPGSRMGCWRQVLRPGLIKGHWKKEEDDIIIQSVNAGTTKWSEIAALIPGRIGKQVCATARAHRAVLGTCVPRWARQAVLWARCSLRAHSLCVAWLSLLSALPRGLRRTKWRGCHARVPCAVGALCFAPAHAAVPRAVAEPPGPLHPQGGVL
jgi:hypothetical protein